MAKAWKALALPVLALTLAGVALVGPFGSAAVPATDDGPAPTATDATVGNPTVAGWHETGITRGNPGGPAHPVK